MDVIVFAIVLVGLAAYVARPLYSVASATRREPARDVSSRRAALMTALRDLEVDRTSGLLDAGGYERERAALESEAATLEDPALD